VRFDVVQVIKTVKNMSGGFAAWKEAGGAVKKMEKNK
jgi:rhodanese-related sulfurtransferase